MKVKIQNIIPFSEARNKLSELVDKVKDEGYFVISKQNRQKAVLVDSSYFSYLQERVEKEEVRKMRESIQESFLTYAQKKLKKKNITDEDAYRLLTGEELTW